MIAATKGSGKNAGWSVLVLKIGTHPAVYSVVVLLAVSALAFFLVIAPSARSLQAGGAASVSDASREYAAETQRYDSLKKLTSKASGVSEKDRELLSYALPAEKDIPGLYIQMMAICARSGVKLVSMDVSDAAEELQLGDGVAEVEGLDIALTVEKVNYDRLKILLANLELNLRFMETKAISFSPVSNNISLTVRTYYLPSENKDAGNE